LSFKTFFISFFIAIAEKKTPENLKPPQYTICPPQDIQKLYIAERKQKTVKVTWTDPTATDDKEIIS
jgi:hypothetical protein